MTALMIFSLWFRCLKAPASWMQNSLRVIRFQVRGGSRNRDYFKAGWEENLSGSCGRIGRLGGLKLAINHVRSALLNDLAVKASLFRTDHDCAGGGALSFVQVNEVGTVPAFDCRVPKTVHVNRAIAAVQKIDRFVRLLERFVVNDLVINVEIEVSLGSFAAK